MGIKSFFKIFVCLAILSQIPSILTAAFKLLLVPGATLLGANSVLLYGLVFVPIYYALKYNHYRALLFSVGVAGTAALAFLPGIASKQLLNGYAEHAAAFDFADPTSLRPRSIQLIGQAAESNVPADKQCDELCRKILMAGVSEVYIGDGTSSSGHFSFRRFRLAERADCRAGAKGSELSSDQPDAEDCIVADDAIDPDPDVVVRQMRIPAGNGQIRANDCSARARLSLAVAIGDLLRLEIVERDASGWKLAERRTGFIGYAVPSPFYVGAVTCPAAGGRKLATQLASEPKVVRSADITELLKRRYNLVL